MRNNAVIYLNGKRLEIGALHAKMMLADFLRYSKGLSGTKIVCAEGDCGACTVLRSFGGSLDFKPINACIVTVAQMDGSSLVTIDAMADGDKLTPVQTSMMTCHGSQCGFCTPGFVMALQGLVEKKLCSKGNAVISERDAKNALTGNLCRCTGYQPILDAATSFNLSDCESVAKRFSSKAQQSDLRKVVCEGLVIEDEIYRFSAPTSLSKAAKALAGKTRARVVGAATDLGVSHNKWRERLTNVVSLHLIPELYEVKKMKGNRLSVGARVTLSELRRETQELIPELATFLDLFASPQIKNIATLIGNVANASPIADTPPFLLVSDAVVEVMGPSGARSIDIEKFFLGYRKTALKKGEVIASISFAISSKNESLVLRKVSERKDLDISAVNTAIRVEWTDSKKIRIKSARVAVGGVAATTLRLKKTEAVLAGQEVTLENIDRAIEVLHSEMTPLSDARGSSAFRHVLVENIFRRFFTEANGAQA